MNTVSFPLASKGSLLIGDIGKGLIFFAIVCYLLSAFSAFLTTKKPLWSKVNRWAFFAGGASFFGAFGARAVLFATNQFEYAYVFAHSDTATDLKYKIAAVWSGQEGSFLLWACASALFGILAIRSAGPYRRGFIFAYSLFLVTLASILAYESPFTINLIHGKAMVPPTGMGLQPSLLNYWILIHPPTIFLGFGSLTVLYCWSLAALIHKDYDKWIPLVRPWAILSLVLLGLGLCMGGFWAYETLGWGGFWAWDPVENSSFVPWCFLAVFIHGIFIQQSKRKWQFQNLLFAGLPFIAFLYGTFLTRSGVLSETSVHSFAKMNRHALWILIGLMFLGTFGLFGLWGVRFKNFLKERPPSNDTQKYLGLHREFAYQLAVILLLCFGIAAGIGMSVPLIKSLSGQKISIVEAGLYHKVMIWFFIPLMIGMGIGPFLSWKGIPFKQLILRLTHIFALTIGILGVLILIIKNPNNGFDLDPKGIIDFPFQMKVPLLPWMTFLAGICLFAFIANFYKIFENWKTRPASMGGILMHLGVILTLSGLILSKGLERSEKTYIQDGQAGLALGYWLRLQGISKDFFHRENQLLFEIVGKGKRFQARPGFYYFSKLNQEPEPVSWPYIHHQPFYDLYFSVGSPIYEASEPLTFKTKEEKFFGKTLVTYKGITRKGEAGMLGTKFIAHVQIQTNSGIHHDHPSLEISSEGIQFHPIRVDENLILYLTRMDAKDQSATLQFFYIKPVYPLEVFYKPMTILVWAGSALMVLGGLVAMTYRFKTRSRD